jgi:hypothetical protein
MRCSNCGQVLPEVARFCFLCGAPVAALASPDAMPARPACRIRLWRGYLKSEFYVELEDPESGDVRELRSPSFRWSGGDDIPADRTEARAAWADLVSRLNALGWEQAGVAPLWYAQSFSPRAHGLHVVAAVEKRSDSASREAS